MRLTLRTLLAYLDDTLPPAEAKLMGAKLAESEQAQEIVERIKNVIRRRRLTVAPTASRIDPNTVAEYLDNEIEPALAEELERICLESDVHLAEAAACHQILSLVLGEAPAPPEAAVKRMYGLAKGGGGKPPRKAARPAPARPALGERSSDETLRMGLPSVFGQDRANRWTIFAAAGLACLLLVVAVMQLLKKPEPTPDGPAPAEPVVVATTPKKVEEKPIVEPIKTPPKPAVEEKKPEPKPAVEKSPSEDVPKAAVGELPPPAFSTVPDQNVEAIFEKVKYAPPSPKLSLVGQLLEPAKGQTSVVVHRDAATRDWKRLGAKSADVWTNRPLVSLPGSRAAVVLNKKVKVTLWGNLPEQIPAPPGVQESVAAFHDHDVLDADLTLYRGRILIANLRDDPVVIRVRFENPSEPGGPETSWLLALSGKGAETLLDRWSMYPLGEPFYPLPDDPRRKGPVAQLACLALSGKTTLKGPAETLTLEPHPGTNLAVWSSVHKKAVALPPLPPPPWLDPKSAVAPEFAKVKGELAAAFAVKAADVATAELLKSNDLLTRRTAVRCLAAMDDLPGLLDMLNQDKAEQRDAAVESLKLWIALSRDNDGKVYDAVLPRMKPNEAEVFMTLLHGFSEKDLGSAETYAMLIELLRHNLLPIRELAAWNLYRMVPVGAAIPYDAADPAKREQAYQRWQKLIPPGKMPPAPPKTKAANDPPSSPRAAATSDRPHLTSLLRRPTMPTVPLVDESCPDPRVRAVFDDIKATKQIAFVPHFWRALANHPEHLELTWSRLKAIMRPGALDLLTKEMIAVAVSATNGCRYCINSHTAALQKLGMTKEQYGELLAVVGLFNQTNRLADSLQIDPDVAPNAAAW